MKICFTSDQHFGHRNIMKFTDREFESVAAMDEALIAAHNEVVGKNDLVYMLGDFTFYRDADKIRPIVDRMNGRWITILGNHDQDLIRMIEYRFERIVHMPYLEVKHGGHRITLCHYPMSEWNASFRGAWHLHGHSHGQWPTSKYKKQDVGVDTNNLRPYTLDDLKDIMKDRKKQDSEIYKPQ